MSETSQQIALARVVEIGAGGPSDDHISLSYDARFLRRKRLVSAGGTAFLIDAPRAVALDDMVLTLDTGARIAVVAADEPVLEVRGQSLARLAWHIGNRHTPCQIRDDHLVIRDDHVLAGMLRGLGAEVTARVTPFTPERGAYGTGRTFGHDHDHAHGQ